MPNHDHNDEVRDLVEKRISEQDRRRDANLAHKLEMVEKLFNMTMQVRSEALTIALSRLEGDGKTCLVRCREQVSLFYLELNNVKEKAIELKTRVDTYINDISEIEELERRILAIESWKDDFWVKNIVSAIVATMAVVLIVWNGFTWLIDFLSKVKIGS